MNETLHFYRIFKLNVKIIVPKLDLKDAVEIKLWKICKQSSKIQKSILKILKKGLKMASSNQEQILTYLKNGNVISPAVAANEFNCYCLAAVIKKIRDKGHEVIAREIPGTRTKEYYMKRNINE